MLFWLFILLGIYAVLLLWMALGFVRTPRFTAVKPEKNIGVTIIICARNEEQYIAACLQSLLHQDYEMQQLQLLLVDDHSTDHTVEMAEKILLGQSLDYLIIRNDEHLGKKKSITKAMALAEHELIITRDADTITQSPFWLRHISEFRRETNADLIIGPVGLYESGSFLKALQTIENSVLTVVSAGSAYFGRAFLCSGANLAFTKTLFSQTRGYLSHLRLPSGDDVLFLDDAKKIPGVKISFIRATRAVVQTYPMTDLRSLFRQRVRWASKFRFNSSSLNLFMALLVFGVNLSFLYCLWGILYLRDTPNYSLFIVLKLLIDIMLLILASSLIKNRYVFWFIMPVAFLYPLYAISIALSSVIFKPNWKK